jgi:hypothetical protein
MIVDVKDHLQEGQTAGEQKGQSPLAHRPGAPAGGSSVDEMSESSFPASDPPAVWTWEVKRPAGPSVVPPEK